MAGTFPNLTSGQVCMYPVQMQRIIKSRVLRFMNDTEQRWQMAPIMNSWMLTYNRISATDLDTLRNFFETQKGGFDKTWTFPFNGTTYTSMIFDQDDFTFEETASAINRYNLSLKCRQVAKSGSYSTGIAATFPQIRTGVTTQYPFTTSLKFKTVKEEMDSGQVYTYAGRSSALRYWKLSFPAITESELGTLLNFFASMQGPVGQFTFTDPRTSVAYTKCRFASDRMDISYISAAVRSTTVEIEEFS